MDFTPTTFSTPDNSAFAQGQKLHELLIYLSRNSPFYKELFANHHIDIDLIRGINDLSAIPFTTKEDLQQRNTDFLCVKRDKVVEYTATSGTLGSPVTIALTENDLNRLSINEYNSFLCADGSSNDNYQLMVTLDRQFMAGIAYYTGLRKLGAGIIRVGIGAPSLQLDTIQRLRPTALVVVPSFILKLIEFANKNKINLNKTSVKKAICIGENIRNNDFTFNALGKRIIEAWDIRLYSTYASTEMQTAFTECTEMHGGHLQPKLLIVELLDDNNLPVNAQVPGEVVITTLGVEGMPLLRYKTGDICMYFDEPCKCGRSSWRISPVIGRKKQMIKYKGTTLYPPALFDILNEIKEVIDFVVEIYLNEFGLDEVLLYLVSVDQTDNSDHSIRSSLQDRLRVVPHIKYVSSAEIQKIQFPESTRKAIKFIDRRV